jgi:uncharacterized protein YktB (UPF0637 family)
MLFDDDPTFAGFPTEGFAVFSIAHREERRRAILDTFHPQLEKLGKLAVRRLAHTRSSKLHVHLPQLNWPPGYQPFCTWLALSFETQGYQEGPQLNLGLHADHVTVRMGWDTRPDLFGRFEFLCRHGGLDRRLLECASRRMKIRVYASADWPQGSRLTFETQEDVAGSFDEVNRRGVWWEIGRRYALPARAEFIASPGFGSEVIEVFESLLPLYERVALGPTSSRDAPG